MNDHRNFQGLRFERPRRVPHKLIALVVTLLVVFALWSWLSHQALIWVLLPLGLMLVWVASYGWRMALAELIRWLRRLERF